MSTHSTNFPQGRHFVETFTITREGQLEIYDTNGIYAVELKADPNFHHPVPVCSDLFASAESPLFNSESFPPNDWKYIYRRANFKGLPPSLGGAHVETPAYLQEGISQEEAVFFTQYTYPIDKPTFREGVQLLTEAKSARVGNDAIKVLTSKLNLEHFLRTNFEDVNPETVEIQTYADLH